MFLSNKITNKTVIFSFVLLAILLLITVTLWLFLKEMSLVILIPVFVTLIVAIQLETYFKSHALIARQNDKILNLLQSKNVQNDNHYRQLEALFSIFKLLPLKHPLPPMRDWAISPDFAALIIALIHERKPKVIVEAGSGVSTLISGYCLKELGQGKVISLEHDEAYAEASRKRVKQHGLQDITTIFFTPLKETTVGQDTWLWYDLNQLEGVLQEIDMLIIDGPPGMIQKLSRYPALPLLFDRLSPHAIVLLDDADRPDECEIVERWTQEFGCWNTESVVSEKGAVVLHVKK